MSDHHGYSPFTDNDCVTRQTFTWTVSTDRFDDVIITLKTKGRTAHRSGPAINMQYGTIEDLLVKDTRVLRSL